MDAIDSARLTAYAVNEPKHLETRTKELEARLRRDPATPAKPKWTREEMQRAAQRVVTAVITTGKMPARHIQ